MRPVHAPRYQEGPRIANRILVRHLERREDEEEAEKTNTETRRTQRAAEITWGMKSECSMVPKGWVHVVARVGIDLRLDLRCGVDGEPRVHRVPARAGNVF